MQKLTMHTSRTYDILIEEGLLASAAERIAQVLPPPVGETSAGTDEAAMPVGVAGAGAPMSGRKCCVVCDRTVFALYGQPDQPLQRGLTDAGYDVAYFAFPPGEENKTLDLAGALCRFLAEQHFTRDDFLIALGGGVCGDVTGFAASIYMRGIPFVQIPTTLLAMADSSVGGKTGVNTEAGKNMVGTFWQPHLVLIDPATLETLDQTQLLNGLAEIIKTGFIGDGSILDAISEGLPEAAAKAIQVKMDIVEQDEHEDGRRRLLNFGHTIGHAIETCSDYSVPHGYAVMTGMYLTALAAEDLGWCAEPVSGLIRNVIEAFAYPVYTEYSAVDLADVAAGDKKRVSDTIVIVYPDRPGHCDMKELPVNALEDFINRGLAGAKATNPA